MRSREKCCCLKLETASLIFGIIACILYVFITVIIIGAMIDFNNTPMQNPQSKIYVNLEDRSILEVNRLDRSPIYTNFVLVMCLLRTVMDFILTAVLCNGVIKRNPPQIKGFINYGIGMSVLDLMMIVRLLLNGGDLIVAFVRFILLIIYGLILVMVNLTYLKILSSSNISEQNRLAATMP